MRHLKTLGRLGWLIATWFWIVPVMAVVLFISVGLGLYAIGRNDLLVALTPVYSSEATYLRWWTYTLVAGIISLILYGFWEMPRFLHDESGQDVVEYALLLGLAAMGAGAFFPNVATSVAVVWAKLNALLAGRTTANIIVADGTVTLWQMALGALAVLLLVLLVRRRRRPVE